MQHASDYSSLARAVLVAASASACGLGGVISGPSSATFTAPSEDDGGRPTAAGPLGTNDGGRTAAEAGPSAGEPSGPSATGPATSADGGDESHDSSASVPALAVGDATGITAVNAADFLRSIGVCTHIGQGVDDAAKSAVAMTFAGIRNLRDSGPASMAAVYNGMHASAGIGVCALSNDTVPGTVELAKQLHAAGALIGIEGPNEPNNFPVKYQGNTSSGTGSFMPVALFQRDLYTAVRAEPSLRDIPVFHSSEAGGSEPDNVGLQFLTIPAGAKTLMPDGTKYADFANVHNYVCGHSGKLVDNAAWNTSDPTLNQDWDGLYVEYGHTWRAGFSGYSNEDLKTLPRVTTETGWLTSGVGSITPEQQGRVFLNLYLSAFSRGFSYTFIYMLRDDTSQGYWGLFDTDYKPKRSGTYLHNLTTVLADTQTRPPGKLDYSIANPPATVHTLLLQKSNAVFELVVWDERASGEDKVTVHLGSSRKAIRVYDPTVGTAATQALSNIAALDLTLSDHPVIIEYDPN